jgi:hypothetical protein
MSSETTDEGDRWAPIRTAGRTVHHAKTHRTVLLIVIVTEFIGEVAFPVGPGEVVLLPMLFAVVIGII